MTLQPHQPIKDPRPPHWWMDWRWLMGVACILLAVGFIMFVRSIIPTNESVQDAEPVLKELKTIAENNARSLELLEKNQEDVKVLVDYVRDLQAETPQTAANLNVFIDLLCSSQDPVRLEACAQLGEDPLGTGVP